ncbi:hypothetical protein [Nocardia farcinica]|uniref:hypothetical protein n=1 Tax=Nocardia farcinica TaxID=37329 RepID=UPI0018945D31|nr:hypothetical protein [Nocardia farcinica]MBF6189508.1 hypothetical protein [Nocardia farcinica]
MTDSTETRYRVVGTNRYGERTVVEKPNANSARLAAEESNTRAAARGWPTDWRAEEAQVVWQPIREQA